MKTSNSIGWIYAIQDDDYKCSTKIGACGSPNGMRCWAAVPCYSPRSMSYRDGWRVEFPFTDIHGKSYETLKKLERHIHHCLFDARLDLGRNGLEWFRLSASDARERVGEILSRIATASDRHIGRVVTNDQFRNPHPLKLDEWEWKIVAWVYQEGETGRVKTQYIDDWNTPKEMHRRYSRNGFQELAAFSYEGSPNIQANKRVHKAWQEVMCRFAHSSHDTVYGWLKENVTPREVIHLYRSLGLAELDIVVSAPPQGVRVRHSSPVKRQLADV